MLSNKTALVVEDEASIRRFIASVLKQQLNCKNVIQSGSAENALEVLSSSQTSRQKIDLILSDWEMDGMKGDELLYNVRSNPGFGQTPFIMVTCRSDRDALITAVQAGSTDYIIKPFSASTLIQKIKKAMGQVENRSMPRADAKNNRIEVGIVFNAFHAYTGGLYDISQTGCLVRTPLFKHGIKGVYEKTELTIKAPSKSIVISAEIARINADRADPPSVTFMMVGFQFDEIDPVNGDRLTRFITALAENKISLYSEGKWL